MYYVHDKEHKPNPKAVINFSKIHSHVHVFMSSVTYSEPGIIQHSPSSQSSGGVFTEHPLNQSLCYSFKIRCEDVVISLHVY